MRPLLTTLSLVTLAIAPLGCAQRSPDEDEWVVMFEDENHSVSFAPASMQRQAGGWYSVWYRTQHQMPRTREGRIWRTETTRSLLRCDGLWFKVAEVRLTDDDRRVVSRQWVSRDNLDRERWRLVPRGTPEEDVARLVCEHAAARPSAVAGDR